MLRRSLVPLFASLLLASGLLQPDAPTAHGDELLKIETRVTYEVRPDEGPIRIFWEVALENNDPATERAGSGPVYSYESLTVPVLRGASAVRASGPTGASLAATVDGAGVGPVDLATVAFDRELYFGDDYAFQLSYELPEVRSNALLVTSDYAFLPAITSGDDATVRIVTTESPEWHVTIETVDCTPIPGGLLACEASEYVQVAAFVEVARAGVLSGFEFSAPLAGGDLSLTVRHFPGEEAWAARMEELANAGLPVLENLFGYNYQGPRTLEIAERGQQDIAGYEGTFGCLFDSCVIGISPLAGDNVALHEFAHLWTQVFENRWIAEGMAEYMSERAAEELSPLVAPFQSGRPARTVDLQLDDWGSSHYLIGATEDDLAAEATGYFESHAFFDVLEETIGLEALQAANAAAAELGGGVDSEHYLDLLEEASGERLDGLFLEEVFPASYAPKLDQRRDLQDRIEMLRPRVRSEGFSLPARIGQLIGEWDFDRAEILLTEAESALDAFVDARERVRAPRDLWTKIGLYGKDPDAKIGEAADAFAAAEYARAERLSAEAVATIDGAEDDALVRVLIAAGVLAVVLIVLAGIFWTLRARTSYH